LSESHLKQQMISNRIPIFLAKSLGPPRKK